MLIHNLVATGSLSYNGVNISYVTGSQTSLDGLNQFSASVNTTTGSLNSTTGSLNTATGSLFTASGSFSTRVTRIEGNYATTGSNVFLGAQTVCANITSTGTIIAQTLNVQQVTSSIVYSSGSNTFGNQLTDVQQFTGSVRITGSLSTTGTICSTGNTCFGGSSVVTGCLGVGIASTTSVGGNTIMLYDASTPRIRLANTTTGTTSTDGGELSLFACDFNIENREASGAMNLYVNGALRQKIFNTGIACFACQVCAPQGIFINGAASLQAQFGQNSDATGTQTSAIDVISRNATNTAGFTFRIQNCATTCTTHLVYSDNTVMAFRCDGNVAIGTTGITNKLIVLGCQTGTQVTTVPIGKFVNTGNEFSKFIVGSDNNNYDAVMSMDNCATLACTKLRFYIGNGTNSTAGHSNDQIVLQGNGNVGIGTASPVAYGTRNLDVNAGSGGSAYIVVRANSNAGTAELAFDTDAGYLSTKSCHPLIIRTNDVERMRITSVGDISFRGRASSASYAMYFYSDDSTSRIYSSDSSGVAKDIVFYTQGAIRMTIAANGNIGAPSGTNIYNASDLRLKRNISTLSNGLDKILNLNPVKFNWIENYVPSEENKDMLGFIAQEIQNIIPEAVETFASGNSITVNDAVIDSPLRVNEKFIIPVLVKAIQEQQCKINILESCLGIN